MKALFFALVASFPVIVCAQKIDIDKVDDFTHSHFVQTTKAKLCEIRFPAHGTFACYYRVGKMDSTYYFKLNIYTEDIVAIDQGENILLKLDNDEVVKLVNTKWEVSGIKNFIDLICIANPNIVDVLKKHKITKARIVTTKYTYEQQVKERNAEKFMNAVALID